MAFSLVKYTPCRSANVPFLIKDFLNVYLLKSKLFRLTKKTISLIRSFKSQKNIKVTVGLLFIISRRK